MTASTPRYLPDYLELESLAAGLLRVAEQVQGDLLLDIGCGQRPYAALFGSVRRQIGLDLPVPKATPARPDVWGDGMALPFMSGVFDVVLCTQVLEHVPQPELLLKESYRVLRRGGSLVLTAPQTWGLHEEPRDYYRFTSHGLRHLLQDAGFRVQTLEARGGVFRMVGQTLIGFWYAYRRVARLNAWRKAINTLWNALFSFLDQRWSWEKDTLGYVVHAVRPEKTGSADGW